jgi:hypothetical protein
LESLQSSNEETKINEMINIYRKQLSIFVLLFVCICFYSGELSAQQVSKTGTTAASFLEIGVGANAEAMGGAFVRMKFFLFIQIGLHKQILILLL